MNRIHKKEYEKDPTAVLARGQKVRKFVRFGKLIPGIPLTEGVEPPPPTQSSTTLYSAALNSKESRNYRRFIGKK